MEAVQLTIDDAIREAQSFSEIVSAQNLGECPREPAFKPSQKQLRAVYDAMKHGRWMTLAEVAFHAKAPEASVSARIRDLKTLGINHEMRRPRNAGVHEYRLR